MILLTSLYFLTEMNCKDTDNGATNVFGEGCSSYERDVLLLGKGICSTYDNEYFIASVLCCTCGGGHQIGK